MLLLMLSAQLCLSSCSKNSSEFCHVYPRAGAKVAKELENLSGTDYPATWEWIGRINKLRLQLEICQTTDF